MGPPTWPATFDRHELVPVGESRYYMTGPDGSKAHGWWRTTAVDAPRSLTFEDGFAGDDGEPSGFLGTSTCTVTLEDLGGRTRMAIVSTFESLEQLEEMIKMGVGMPIRNAALGAVGSVMKLRAARW